MSNLSARSLNHGQGIESLLIRLSIGIALTAIVSWLALSIFGATIIKDAYQGRSIAILNSLITGQSEHPVTEYLTAFAKLTRAVNFSLLALAGALYLLANAVKYQAHRRISFLIWPVFIAFVFYYFEEMTHGGNDWKTGDWLINFNGGAVRRGLIGNLLFYISEFGPPLKWLTFLVQVVFYFFIFFFTQRIYLMRERGAEWLLLLFSPAFIFFPFYDYQGGFRKEILVFVSFLILAHSYAKRDLSGKTIIASFVLFLLSVFSHELAALTLPFFGYILYRSYHSGLINRRFALVSMLMFSVAALSSLLFAVTFPGGADVSRQICASAISKGFSIDICGGAIEWLRFDSQYGLSRVADQMPQYVFVYFPLAILATLPLFISDWSRKNAAILLIGLGFLLPLFVIALDWGRWLHIYVFFVFILMLSESVWREVKIRRLPIWAVLVYLTVWSMPHCCAERIPYGLADKAFVAVKFISNKIF